MSIPVGDSDVVKLGYHKDGSWLREGVARWRDIILERAAENPGLTRLDSDLRETQPQVLVSDIRMPGRSGLELLQAVKQRHPAVPVIVMTAYSDLDSAVAAFQGGAYEYLPDSVAKFPDQKRLAALMERQMRAFPWRAQKNSSQQSGDRQGR